MSNSNAPLPSFVQEYIDGLEAQTEEILKSISIKTPEIKKLATPAPKMDIVRKADLSRRSLAELTALAQGDRLTLSEYTEILELKNASAEVQKQFQEQAARQRLKAEVTIAEANARGRVMVDYERQRLEEVRKAAAGEALARLQKATAARPLPGELESVISAQNAAWDDLVSAVGEQAATELVTKAAEARRADPAATALVDLQKSAEIDAEAAGIMEILKADALKKSDPTAFKLQEYDKWKARQAEEESKEYSAYL